MKLKMKYGTQAEIPQGYDELFTEQGGSWNFTAVEGMKTQEDINKLNGSLTAERADHKATKSRLRVFVDMDEDTLAQTMTRLDGYDELEARANAGDTSGDDFEDRVAARVKTATAPFERSIAKLNAERDTITLERDTLLGNDRKRTKTEIIRQAAIAAKVNPAVIDDVLVIAGNHLDLQEDGTYLSSAHSPTGEGLDVTTYFDTIQDTRRHWWPESQGGGAGGGDGNGGGANPWSKDNWDMSAQGAAYRKDPVRAANMAKAAGTTIGGLPKK
jgi:hypothetical protein